ncbi:MAG TPA: Bcr/CflA family multidrug efflux MFS transporter [Vicinamibacterales bacterium]|jgi:DHA1 family bicyclomycin/chloramphenicol resistance-like MFS transporter|nr:Bcr/CflA family multidrug efflux MFS transporter [Vicinamibacterales bacterium]
MEDRGAAYYRLALILGSLTAMGPLAIDTYLPALPTITREFDTSASAVQLSLSVYFIGIALGQAFYGPFSDRHGRRPPLFAGLGLFVIGSLGCALAPGIRTLVSFRFIQALGGCAPLVVPRAIVRDLFDERDSIRMLSVLILVMGVAPILAPLAGGQLLVHLGWRSIFWFYAAYGTILLTIVTIGLRESLPDDRRSHQPIGMVVRMYGRLLADWQYMGYVLSGGLIFAGLLGYISGSPFIYIDLFHISPERFGLFFGANAVGIIGGSQINRWLVHRFEARDITRAMLTISLAASIALLVAGYTGAAGLVGIIVPLFFFIAMHGFVSPNTTGLAMTPYGGVAGKASALMGTIQFGLGAASGALIGAMADGTARPFVTVLAGCGFGAFLLFQLTHVPSTGVRVTEIRSGGSLDPPPGAGQ